MMSMDRRNAYSQKKLFQHKCLYQDSVYRQTHMRCRIIIRYLAASPCQISLTLSLQYVLTKFSMVTYLPSSAWKATEFGSQPGWWSSLYIWGTKPTAIIPLTPVSMMVTCKGHKLSLIKIIINYKLSAEDIRKKILISGMSPNINVAKRTSIKLEDWIRIGLIGQLHTEGTWFMFIFAPTGTDIQLKTRITMPNK